MSQHCSLLLEGRDLCVAIENNCQGRTRVATKFFYVAIEGF